MTYLFLIIPFFVFILTITISYIYKKRNHKSIYLTMQGAPLAVLNVAAGVILFIMTILWGLYRGDIQNQKTLQKELPYLIKTYNPSEDYNLIVLNNLLNNVKVYNNRITEHKKEHDNIFWGFLYSKEIAEMEYIPIENLKSNLNLK